MFSNLDLDLFDNYLGGLSLIDLKDKEHMQLYYACKNRFDYTLKNREFFIEFIANKIRNYVSKYCCIVIPESSSSFLKELMDSVGVSYIVAKKTEFKDVELFRDLLNLQKKERLSHIERFNDMGGVFKINAMKATQRVKYESVLFQKINLPEGKVLIIDDSCFSGTTYRALKTIIPNGDYLSIFTK